MMDNLKQIDEEYKSDDESVTTSEIPEIVEPKKMGRGGKRISRVMTPQKLELLALARVRAFEVRKKNSDNRKLQELHDAENPLSNNVPVKSLKKSLKQSIKKEINTEEVNVDLLLSKKLDKMKLEEKRINDIVTKRLLEIQTNQSTDKTPVRPPGRPRKKVIYEDSDDEEEEIIVRRKKKPEPVAPPVPPPPPQPTQQEIADNLHRQQFSEFQNQIQNSMLNRRMFPRF